MSLQHKVNLIENLSGRVTGYARYGTATEFSEDEKQDYTIGILGESMSNKSYISDDEDIEHSDFDILINYCRWLVFGVAFVLLSTRIAYVWTIHNKIEIPNE